MATASENHVDLGFVESTESWRLSSHMFPSKVGGKPAWLALKNIPKACDLQCSNCGRICLFLLQVYAPIEEDPRAFHRTIFIFICKDPLCSKSNSNSNFIVWRSQLCKENEYYSSVPPDDTNDSSGPSASDHGGVCVVCGCAGSSRCARCHVTTYCSKEHQTIDWKAGHKASCGQDDKVSAYSTLFPEYDIVTEEEPELIADSQKSEETRLKEYKDFVSSKHMPDDLQSPNSDKDLENMAAAMQDKAFDKFRTRTDIEPAQVLRYDRNGLPLWVSNEGIPNDKDIPNCSCGASRVYEFQIMPQLLQHLGVDSTADSIDWGTLVVYTCAESCSSSNEYSKEFLWKQDFSNINNT